MGIAATMEPTMMALSKTTAKYKNNGLIKLTISPMSNRQLTSMVIG